MKRFLPVYLLSSLFISPAPAVEDGRKVQVTVQLRSGKQITGLAADYDDFRIILQVRDQVVAVEWDDVDTSSAYQTKKKILEAVRGSARNLTAEDHFQLGYFLAVRNRHTAAVSEFRRAQQRDPSFAERVKTAWRDIRRAKERNAKKLSEPIYSAREAAPAAGAMGRTRHGMIYQKFTEEEHRLAVKAVKQFVEQTIRSEIAPDMVLLETRHFLIWTDWPEAKRNLIPDWAEQLYNAMCEEFGFPKHEPIWRGKCPIFCFKNKSRFNKFAKAVDGYDSKSALGYTKTADDGYVHVVLHRLGNSPADIDRFATTMVHETAHALMHCYGSPRNLPPWLNEGLADHIAERVLGDRCSTGEIAVAFAKQFVQQKKPIKELFAYDRSPPAQFYPICQSLVQYLIHTNAEAFVGMINDIKGGLEGRKALAKHYKGLNTNTLEHSWRAWVAKTFPAG